MTLKRGLLLGLGAIVLLSILALVWVAQSLNRFQINGNLDVSGLTEPVDVLRDDKGIAHIFARNQQDLFFAQGFVTAQHRLFQLEFYRHLINGRLAEVLGQHGYRSDVTMRLMGIRRNAREHAARLDPETRRRLSSYARGVSAYVREFRHEHHLELRLLGITPQAMTVEDIMAILHFVGYSQTRNYPAELMYQRVIDAVGVPRAGLLLSLDPTVTAAAELPELPELPGLPVHTGRQAFTLDGGALLLPQAEMAGSINLGSNAWAVGPEHSGSGQAILANDPHLDARTLPGIWHPVGLYAPGIEAVGAAIPGLPGLVIGRNRHVAFGVTNGYADVQDVYIETLDPADPERYLDNGHSWHFQQRQEIIRIKDDKAAGGFREQTLLIRSTPRGPVISDHLQQDQGSQGDNRRHVLTLRWSAAEEAGWEPGIGIDQLILAQTVDDVDRAAQAMSIAVFNVVFAGQDGAIGFRSSGRVPVRADGQGQRLRPVPPADDWLGWIAAGAMPGRRGAGAESVVLANNDTRPEEYPYYYSAFFAPPYRLQRLQHLIGEGRGAGADQHWAWMQDTHNLQAEGLRPLFLQAMDELLALADQDPGNLQAAREMLAAWNLRDDAELGAPLLYQAIYRQFALQAFSQVLGASLGEQVLGFTPRWQQGLDRLAMGEGGLSSWLGFTDGGDAGELARTAVAQALGQLEQHFGSDPGGWQWGDAHRIVFTSPLRPSGFGRDLLGGGEHPYPGSGETVLRGAYSFQGTGPNPWRVKVHDSLRLVVDFADDDRIMAVVAGGVVGRQFSRHFRDQFQHWLAGTPQYWWFGEDAVRRHAVSKSTMTPYRQ